MKKAKPAPTTHKSLYGRAAILTSLLLAALTFFAYRRALASTTGDYAGAWKEIGECRRYGLTPSPNLLKALSDKMPEPME